VSLFCKLFIPGTTKPNHENAAINCSGISIQGSSTGPFQYEKPGHKGKKHSKIIGS
jgi:hypothetical protein